VYRTCIFTFSARYHYRFQDAGLESRPANAVIEVNASDDNLVTAAIVLRDDGSAWINDQAALRMHKATYTLFS
jgi:hypothetical protein